MVKALWKIVTKGISYANTCFQHKDVLKYTRYRYRKYRVDKSMTYISGKNEYDKQYIRCEVYEVRQGPIRSHDCNV